MLGSLRRLSLGFNAIAVDQAETGAVEGSFQRGWSAKTGASVSRLLPAALDLLKTAAPKVSTSEINRAVRDAFEKNQPPMRGKRRLRLYYATQVSQRPFTVLAFVNDPSLVRENFHRYLEGSLRQRFGIRAAPVRVRFRARTRKTPDDSSTEGGMGAP